MRRSTGVLTLFMTSIMWCGLAVAEPATIRYTISAGDTLFSIAKRYGLSVAELRAQNNLRDDVARLYTVLNITPKAGFDAATSTPSAQPKPNAAQKVQPVTKPSTKPATPATKPMVTNTQVVRYTIRRGDSLSAIANRYGITLEDLKSYNRLPNNVAPLGKVLLIPGQAPSTQTVSWQGMQIVLPSRLIAGQAFRVEFWGAQAAQLKVQFSGETEVLKPVYLGEQRYLVLGRIPLGSKAQDVSLRIGVLKHTLPLPVRADHRAVQSLGFETAEFLHMNASRAKEDQKLAAIYAIRSPQYWKKSFVAPAKGYITSPFGTPRRYTPKTPIAYHTGADYGTAVGTPIYATNRGRVALVAKYQVRGNITVIDHGLGVFSVYLHQSKVAVQVGDIVDRGQYIGAVGNTGLSTGAHLHWEMVVRGKHSEPRNWLGQLYP